jgi:hypothetical protein
VTRSRLWLLHSPFGVSLAEKMDQITNVIIQDGTHREKNLQDAVGFLQGAVGQNGGNPINYSQIKTWSRQFGKTLRITDRNIHFTAQFIEGAMPAGHRGFASTIFKAADDYESAGSG